MITESFLNSCFTLILNKKSRVKKTKALYRDILEVLQFTDKKDKVDIPLPVKSKLECLVKICNLLIEDKTIGNVLDSISFSEKFDKFKDFLETKINEDLTEVTFQDIIKQIRLRKKVTSLFQNFDQFSKVIEKIKDGTFDSLDDLIEDYEATIKILFSSLMESNRSTAIEAAASLDLTKDMYEHVIEMIVKKYNRSNKTPTGFDFLDNVIMYGGYEPSRLYVFGGGSGAGKSTFINNTILWSALSTPNINDPGATPPKPGVVSRVYLYITLENTIEEALMRTYQPLFDVNSIQMLHDITNGVNIRQKLNNALLDHGSTIIMKYFPATTISYIDLMGVLDEAKETYPDATIAGLYIDYLDLLKTETKYDIYRLELGHITLSLKSLAVQYNIPIITGTQLNRPAYDVKESRELGVGMISESIKKVEHADFVALLTKDPVDDTIVHGKIGKNRGGKSNVSIDFKVDFSRFKFLSATQLSNSERSDKIKDCKLKGSFGGGVGTM